MSIFLLLCSQSALADGPRIRATIGAVGGTESVSDDFGESLTVGLVGIEAQLGVQINDLFAVYAKPDLQFGTNELTGTLGFLAMAEATFADRVFVGAGAGYTIYNNPAGPSVAIRAGGYPLMKRMDDWPRRKGLMLAAEVRPTFLRAPLNTGVQVLGTIGYAAF